MMRTAHKGGAQVNVALHALRPQRVGVDAAAEPAGMGEGPAETLWLD